MEQQLLQEMVVERDIQIDNLCKTLQRQDDLAVKLRNELEEVRLQTTESCLQHSEEIRVLRSTDELVQNNLSVLQNELTRVGSLSVYKKCFSAEKPKNENAARLLRCQAQLCKALHFIHVIRNELLLLKSTGDEQINALKKVVATITDEKCRMEMTYMNRLMEVDGKKRQLQDDYKAFVETLDLKCLEFKESSSSAHSRTRGDKKSWMKKTSSSDQDSETVTDSEDDESSEEEEVEIEVLDREERRKLFEKRKEDLMRKRAALSRHYIPEGRKQ